MNILDTISDNIFAQDNNTGFQISIVIFILLTIRAVLSLNKTSELYKFFTNTKTVGQLCVIVVWCYLIYRFVKTHPKDKKHSAKLQEATKKAILALIIAFFARVNLVIAPFWLVWLIAYYLEDWV
jgi:amino acid permease|tara:strand:+ start:86 stop:460 length:375 start_codon:yes stop_codon:yes gene_type:complete